MITPNFKISQDDDSLLVEIEAPHGELSSFDLDYHEDLFLFSCSPYYLRLHLTGQVIDFAEGKGHIKHDIDTGIFQISVPKKSSGQFFPRLEMITELLRPQRELRATGDPVIQEMGEKESDTAEDEEMEDEEICADLVEQQLPTAASQQPTTSGGTEAEQTGYGFAWKKHGVLEKLASEIKGLCDLLEPADLLIESRIQACTLFDAEYFDPDRYLVDNFREDYQIDNLLSLPFKMKLSLTAKDRNRLKDLPRKKIQKLSSSLTKSISFGLFDILIAFAYDQRVNEWSSSCVSGKNIVKLSPTLSFHVKYDNLKEAVIGVIRRILCYALYRNWDLATLALNDARKILRAGPSAVVHSLCKIHSAMIATGEFHYLLNDLYVTEYLIWIQSVNQKLMKSLLNEAEKIKISKSEIPFELLSIEEEVKQHEVGVDIANVALDSDDEK